MQWILQDQLATAWHPTGRKGAHTPTDTYCVAISVLGDNSTS